MSDPVEIGVSSGFVVGTTMGPLPPASEYALYEQTMPGSANRMMIMAENQSQHRIDMDKKIAEDDSEVVRANIKLNKRGLNFNFILGCLPYATATFLAINNQLIVAGVVGAGIIVNAISSAIVSIVNKKNQDGR